jgi:hypothetical protein
MEKSKMKKIFSTATTIGMLLGLSATASAIDFSISGEYDLDGYLLSHGNGNGLVMDGGSYAIPQTTNGINSGVYVSGYAAGQEVGSDTWLEHTFFLAPEMTINNKLTFKADVYLANYSKFGNQTNSDLNNSSSDSNSANGDLSNYGGIGGVEFHKLYMEYQTGNSKLVVGRTPAGSWAGDFLNSDNRGNRIIWYHDFESSVNSMVLYFEKIKEIDSQSITQSNTAINSSAGDIDAYHISYKYSSLAGAAYNMGLTVFDDKMSRSDSTGDYTRGMRYRLGYYYENPKLAGYNLITEFSYDFGSWQDYKSASSSDIDLSTYAIYLNLSSSLDKLVYGLTFFNATGDSQPGDNKHNSALNGPYDGVGGNFSPYYILTGSHSGMLNGDGNSVNSVMAASGVVSLGVYSDIFMSDEFIFHCALAWAQADKTGKLLISYDTTSGATTIDRKKDYGVELDLGIKYQFMKNMSYEIKFGYLETGNFFKATTAGTNTVPTTDLNCIYTLSNHLAITF